jgi:hypothetical protein
MKYLILFKSDTDSIPACKDKAEMGGLIGELQQSGALLATEGLHPTHRGALVKLHAGEAKVTDGPFAEAKEIIAGFVLLDVPSKAEAVRLSQRFLTIAGTGTAEVREVIV